METLRLPALGAGNLIKWRGGAAEGHTCPCGSHSPHPALLSRSPACAGEKTEAGTRCQSCIITEEGRADAQREWSSCSELSTDAKGTVAMKEGLFFILCSTAGTEIKASLIAKEACNNKNGPFVVPEVRTANVKQHRHKETQSETLKMFWQLPVKAS